MAKSGGYTRLATEETALDLTDEERGSRGETPAGGEPSRPEGTRRAKFMLEENVTTKANGPFHHVHGCRRLFGQATTLVVLLVVCVVFLAAFFYISVSQRKHEEKTRTSQTASDHHDSLSPTAGIHRPSANLPVNLTWTRGIPGVGTESAIRLVDVNRDGVKDILVGFDIQLHRKHHKLPPAAACRELGFAGTPCGGGLFAMDGATGKSLWQHGTDNEVFSIVCDRLDVNRDGRPDCLIAGRHGVLEAVDVRNGMSLWNDSSVREQLVTKWNVYSPLVIPDIDQDGTEDILIAHGGDSSFGPWELCRAAGVVMIMSGRTGRRIGQPVPMPDMRETYMSPVMLTLPGKVHTKVILVGTGGETVSGSLWAMRLDDILAQARGTAHSGTYKEWVWGQHRSQPEHSNAIKLVTGHNRGVAVPPVLVDLTGDGVLDIIVSVFDGQVVVLNGKTCEVVWKRSFTGWEYYRWVSGRLCWCWGWWSDWESGKFGTKWGESWRV